MPNSDTLFNDSFTNSDIQALLSKLDDLDKSIDYLAAAITGDDPLGINVRQLAYGRLAAPRRVKAASAQQQTPIQRESKITKTYLRKLVQEELADTKIFVVRPTAGGELITSNREEAIATAKIWQEDGLLDVEGTDDEIIQAIQDYQSGKFGPPPRV